MGMALVTKHVVKEINLIHYGNTVQVVSFTERMVLTAVPQVMRWSALVMKVGVAYAYRGA